MGPRLLFDKSFLQSLSLDEAVLLDHFFSAVVSPIFYVETLSDLEKTGRSRRSPDDEVRIISSKIPSTNSAPMLFHPAFAVRELMGTPVLMDGRMFLSRAKTVAFRGQKGIVQNPGPEHSAFERWQNRQFLSRERSFAKSWRQKLRRVDSSTLKASTALYLVGTSPCSCPSARKLPRPSTRPGKARPHRTRGKSTDGKNGAGKVEYSQSTGAD